MAARSSASLPASSSGRIERLQALEFGDEFLRRSRLFQKSGAAICCSICSAFAFLAAKSKRVSQLHDPLLDGFGAINPFSFHGRQSALWGKVRQRANHYIVSRRKGERALEASPRPA